MGNPVPRPKNIMSQSTYQTVVLAKRPKATIVPGETFEIKEKPILEEGDLREGQILVETLYLSLDPAMRGWLNGRFCFLCFRISILTPLSPCPTLNSQISTTYLKLEVDINKSRD